MLISFSIENFKSFKERAQISLVPKRADTTIRGAMIPVELPGMTAGHLLSAAAIYGANASGKTNFLLALRAMKDAVVRSQSKWQLTSSIPIDQHLNNTAQPTEFEIELVSDGVRYRYGFLASQKMFIREWLYSYPKGRERELFNRTTEGDEEEKNIQITFGKALSGLARDHQSTMRRVRPNSLFLSAAAQDNQSECASIYKWFYNNLFYTDLVKSEKLASGFTSLLASDFTSFHTLLGPIMKIADSSISNIKIEKTADDGPEFLEIDLDTKDGTKTIVDRSNNTLVLFTLTDGKNSIDVDYNRESRGVKRLYSIASQLITTLAQGKILVVDELESSMHAHVASKILALFQSKASNPHGAQIIFTTHDTRLLSLQHLRRDQIWFCEREGLSSQIYSLQDFSPRKDENFETNYLRGRYGAVPKATIDPVWIANINNGLFMDEKSDND